MAALGPYEPAPFLAVGVSGGPDSMALALLTDEWAGARGGSSVALTVDHRLREESAREAVTIADWLAVRSIDHRILPWDADAPPDTGIQATARDARRRLLLDWCRAHGVLHLLLAHNREDMLETVVMRLARAPAGPGVAGMAAIAEARDARILRPLLPVSRAVIERTLRRRFGQDWIEDPSNRDRRYERVRVRHAVAEWTPAERDGCLHRARRAASERAGTEDEAAGLVAAAVRWNPAGYAWVDRSRARTAPPNILSHAVGHVLRTVGGREYVPGGAKLDRLCGRLRDDRPFTGATLAGCRIVDRSAAVLICREPAVIGDPVPVEPGEAVIWDGRFHLRLAGRAPGSGYAVGPLGAAGWGQIRTFIDAGAAQRIPHPARLGLPAVFRNGAVSEVPHLGFLATEDRHGGRLIAEIAPRPPEPVTKASFFIAFEPE